MGGLNAYTNILIMETKGILTAIKKLPVGKRMLIIEKTLKTIREIETKKEMIKAVDLLFDDYKNDKELTVFTQLDQENFYETR